LPSHRIHRICGYKVGLPEHVLKFIDRLIDDENRCGVHDVGLEVLSVMVNKRLNIGVAIEHGLVALIECLRGVEVINDQYLDGAALHFLLDCIDRKIQNYYGTETARKQPYLILEICAKDLEEKWERQLYRYFFLEADLIQPYIEDMSNRIHSLIKNHRDVMKECVDMIVQEVERRMESRYGERGIEIIRRGQADLLELLKKLCEKKNLPRCLYYVNGQLLPVAAAVKKIMSLLENNNKVIIMSEYGGVKITASNLKDLREKIIQLIIKE